jgi:hypothetical protein
VTDRDLRQRLSEVELESFDSRDEAAQRDQRRRPRPARPVRYRIM